MTEKPTNDARPGVTPKTTTEEWPREIRTTMEPNRPYRVSRAEYLDLKANGLLKGEN